MPWVYIDDKFDQHPKVVEAGSEAAWMFVAGLCWCNRNLTAGRIPKDALRLLTDKRSGPLAARLVAVNLWEETPDGYFVHDYDFWNKTAKSMSEKAKKAAEKRWGKDAQAQPEHPPADAGAMPGHSPSSSPGIPRARVHAPGPNPIPPLTSPSSSSSTRGGPDDDDGSLRREAQARLDRRVAEKGPVGDPDAWLATCIGRLRNERDVTTTQRQRIDGCPTCEGRGVVELPDGTYRQCHHERAA